MIEIIEEDNTKKPLSPILPFVTCQYDKYFLYYQTKDGKINFVNLVDGIGFTPEYETISEAIEDFAEEEEIVNVQLIVKK